MCDDGSSQCELHWIGQIIKLHKQTICRERESAKFQMQLPFISFGHNKPVMGVDDFNFAQPYKMKPF